MGGCRRATVWLLPGWADHDSSCLPEGSSPSYRRRDHLDHERKPLPLRHLSAHIRGSQTRVGPGCSSNNEALQIINLHCHESTTIRAGFRDDRWRPAPLLSVFGGGTYV